MLVGVAMLAPLDVTSTLFGTTGTLELGHPEPPRTPGTSMQLSTLCLVGQMESPDSLLGAVLLVTSGNMCLTSVTSRQFAMVKTPDSTWPESPMMLRESPGRLTLPGRMSGQRDCTPLLDHPNRILALPR